MGGDWRNIEIDLPEYDAILLKNLAQIGGVISYHACKQDYCVFPDGATRATRDDWEKLALVLGGEELIKSCPNLDTRTKFLLDFWAWLYQMRLCDEKSGLYGEPDNQIEAIAKLRKKYPILSLYREWSNDVPMEDLLA